MQRSPHFLIPAEAGNLSVDQTQGVSLYIQVANILRYAILSGAIAPGSRLPTVVELGDHFKVARITIREAIRVLAEEGLLVSSRGRGIHVLQHPSQSKPAPQIADAMDADVSSVEIVILAVDDLTTVPA
ncbi:MAG: GntR family transcriptional regulator, partial [Ottowia sp.]|nr:GntR family transcriptional regulator [Ottowia sp.]